MVAQSLHDLFVEELEDLLDAENQLVKTLPKLAEAANDPILKKAFKDHLKQTETHVERLETVFESLGEKAHTKTCKGMAGLLKEGEEILKAKDMDPAIRDAGLIAASERVEQYEMAGYCSAMSAADELGYIEAYELLESTYEEEDKANALLMEIAGDSVNPAAHSVRGSSRKEPVGASR